MFKSIMIENGDSYQVRLQNHDDAALSDGDVTVSVLYSTLNYKDALAITGKGPVVRRFPMVPGIDLAGIVEHSDSALYRAGDHVILNGWGIGEMHWGGLAQKARVNSEWLIPLPDGLTPRQAMAIGTAGYTAMLCVMALQQHQVTPDKGPIVVSGASGGVGSIAIALLAGLGYEVAGITGRADEAAFIKALGASEILSRDAFSSAGKPLAGERWAGAVDVVGSHVLANICAAMRYDGVVTACGLAGGMDFPATVAPFILRGVTLVGINSVLQPFEQRLKAWQMLARHLDLGKLENITREITLEEAIPFAAHLLQGKVHGRIVVDVNR